MFSCNKLQIKNYKTNKSVITNRCIAKAKNKIRMLAGFVIGR
jgi:hypothetical protein